MKRQHVINHDTKTANTLRRINMNIAKINHFKGTLTSLSAPVPMMMASDLWMTSRSMWTTNELTRSSQTAERELSHLSVKYTAECHQHSVKERYLNWKWHWRSVKREQQQTQNGSLRNAELAYHCLGSTATDRNELGFVTQVWCEPLQCTTGYTKIQIESRF